jgi:hypothetical protein
MLGEHKIFMRSKFKSSMTSLMLGDLTLESLTPSVSVPLIKVHSYLMLH